MFITMATVADAQEGTLPTRWLMPKPQSLTETRTTFDLQRPSHYNRQSPRGIYIQNGQKVLHTQ